MTMAALSVSDLTVVLGRRRISEVMYLIISIDMSLNPDIIGHR